MPIDSPILPLIHSYQGYVADAIARFRQMGVRGSILRAWRRSAVPTWRDDPVESDPVLPERGFLDAEQLIAYSFHGIGCRVKYDDIHVDFDFGPDGRHDGFDAWRLRLFAESVPRYTMWANYELLQQHLTALKEAGHLINFPDSIGSHLYFFADPAHSNST